MGLTIQRGGGGASDATLATSDITTNNVSTTKHGFAPKAPNDATKYLDGTGAYSVPAGGSGASTADTFVTISHDTDLTSERVLTAGAGIGVTDGGANSTVTVALSGIGARVYNSANISISNNTLTALTFDSERYDTDTIHDTSSNTGRLTCKTAGKYLIVANPAWAAAAGGQRYTDIRLNGTTVIAAARIPLDTNGRNDENTLVTIYSLAVNDYVELRVYHDQGSPLNIINAANYSPEFMMHLIG